ncbi:MAG: Pyruvate kinase [Candidatus Roizmanbacteria bacterium GW2011_GWC2_37_13]|uniref:Pyruvate kinase n=1 Tax=Candidatus Roizmanbacteria bacterium GW2011_GWC2_37_13 TaxID=1618486 RepID=A0A0G0G1T0_9BACT|nr:MAG: Pyruvate kinase [Candidatus Roizmanbacteria bacterium GW2011_GWC2_37_13]
MRRTKIICTIGPNTQDYKSLLRLAELGMNVVRLNMSHGDHIWHSQVIKAIKSINSKGKYSLSILMDTKGPEVRTGDLKHQLILKKGDIFNFTISRQAKYQQNTVEVNYDGFIDDIKIDDIILIDGGMISFRVKNKTKNDAVCECLDGGTLTSRRHLNIRGKSARLPTITKKDWEDIKFGIKEGFDFIALSFVKNRATIEEVKTYLKKQKAPIDVIAKIESAQSIPYIDEIIESSDGVMVARGDLGAELPIEEVPLIQEEIVSQCLASGKPVIVATHLLESMIENPTPTRAEVTDIFLAVRQKADAIMLSGETAVGLYPYKAVSVMSTVAERIEKRVFEDKEINIAVTSDPKTEVARSASILANNLNSAAILVFTRRGYMGTLVSKCRPNSSIYAFTNMTSVRRRLNYTLPHNSDHWSRYVLTS